MLYSPAAGASALPIPSLARQAVSNFKKNDDLSLLDTLLEQLKPVEGEPIQYPKPFVRCAAYKGGGVKVTAYLGVAIALKEKKLFHKLEYLVGSSGGCIISIMMALGFSANQIVRMFNQLDLTDFTDQSQSLFGSFFASSVVGKAVSIGGSSYLYTGENMKDWIEGLLEHVLGSKHATFQDLQDAILTNPALKHFSAIATSNTSGKDKLFSYEETPHVLIADAFRASTALPAVYVPVVVRKREPDGLLTPIGVFYDGGVRNNFPNATHDTDFHCDKHHPLYTITTKNSSVPHPVNPSSVGFTLITHPWQLDPELTPFTDELRALKQQAGKGKSASQKPNPSLDWSRKDILYAIWTYYFGTMTPENSQEKYDTHPKNTVQIYAGDVGTTEFDIPDEKAQKLIGRGHSAFNNWYEKFLNPKSAYKGTFNDSLTAEEMADKADDKKAFYVKKTSSLIRDFFDELSRCKDWPDDSLNENVRLKYLVRHLRFYRKKLDKQPDEGLWFKAYLKAQSDERDYRLAMSKVSEQLEHIVSLEAALAYLGSLLENSHIPGNFDRFETLFKGQLSNVFKLCLRFDHNLLNIAVKHCPERVDFIIGQLKVRHDHLYQISRAFKLSIVQMLNQLPPTPLLYSAAERDDLAGIDKCLEIGLEPNHLNWDGLTAIHHAIVHNKTDVCIRYFKWMQQRRCDPNYVRHGLEQTPLLHFIWLNNPSLFKHLINHQRPIMDWLYKGNPKDAKGIEIFELLSSDPSTWALFSATYKPVSPTSIPACQANIGTKNEAYSGHIVAAIEGLKAEGGTGFDPDKVKGLSANDALQILGNQTQEHILVQSIIHHWNDFFKAYLNRCIELGFQKELVAFLNNQIDGKTLVEYATLAGNVEVSSFLAEILKSRNEHDCHLPHVGQRVEMTNQFAKKDQDYSLHDLATSGSVEAFYANLSPTEGVDAKQFIKNKLVLTNLKGESPLSLLFTNKRTDILSQLPEFIARFELSIETILSDDEVPIVLPQVPLELFKRHRQQSGHGAGRDSDEPAPDDELRQLLDALHL